MSENPYKGVPGGDPRMRSTKKKVRIKFICAKCNGKKTELLPEGKNVEGRACVDCRNAEGVEKNRIKEEEATRRWEETRRQAHLRPQRTEEEKAALLEEYADAPQHECADCGRSFHVSNPALPFNNDDIWRKNAILTVSFITDPFREEIYGDTTMDWRCRHCRYNSAMEI